LWCYGAASLNDIPATSNSFLSIAPKTHLDPPPQFETMSFLDTLDGYVIPPQNNRQSHTLTSSSKPGEVSSTKTTRIKREAIVQSIRKAMEDDDDDDDLGDGDGNGDGDGDGDGEGEGEEVNVDGGKRLKREETPTRAITFISSDEPLTRLGTRLVSLVDPSATFPPQSDPIWAYDSIRSNYFADIDEDAVYDHLESTVILLLFILFDITHAILLRHTGDRHWERAMSDGGRFKHPPLWEVKRVIVFALIYFVHIRRAAGIGGGIRLFLEGEEPVFGWPGDAEERWNVDGVGRKTMEEVLKQVSASSLDPCSFHPTDGTQRPWCNWTPIEAA